jgi:hypothetical protein
MSYYVNKYGSKSGDTVNYALIAQSAIPHSVTRHRQFYLLQEAQATTYGRQQVHQLVIIRGIFKIWFFVPVK